MDSGEDFVRAPLPWWHAIQASLEFQQFTQREEGVDIDLPRHHANGAARLTAIAVNVKISNSHLAHALDHQSGQNIDQGGVASTVRTRQADNRAPENIHVNTAQGLRHFTPAIGLA